MFARDVALQLLQLLSVVAAHTLASLSTLLPTTIAVAIFLETAGFAAVAAALLELGFCVSTGEGVGVASDDFVDGFCAFHIVTGILAGLTEAGLGRGRGTWSHILPTEKQAQYILRHWLLLQLHPVYLFYLDEALSSSRTRRLAAVLKREESASLIEDLVGVWSFN